MNRLNEKRAFRLLKRLMDIAGSLFALVLSIPLLLVISILIKLTSRGPVLFRQERVGLNGQRFILLKFRSMHVANDSRIHEEYVERLIAGAPGNQWTTVHKLTDDPRVTRVGKLLRRTSLDELPQLFNVLAGTMSLVGPRPPIPYEVSRYAAWHTQRLAVKPGITGLWQVRGRSRVTFDDMVRLDIKYITSWSLWLDVKILCQTVGAVVSGRGAW
jgi:exopolysaccharide biosynthesis polyprenyl glycosylphosphotransferase